MVDKVKTANSRNLPALQMIAARRAATAIVASAMLVGSSKHSVEIRKRKLPECLST